MKIPSTLFDLKERTIKFSLTYLTLISKNYNQVYKYKSPGSVVGLSSGPVANFLENFH